MDELYLDKNIGWIFSKHRHPLLKQESLELGQAVFLHYDSW